MKEVSVQKKLELLNKIPFFQDFSSEDLEMLADLTHIEQAKAGETVVKEDSLNLTLRFLINGALEVLVKEEMVASFRGGGQVFGEMGLVSHELASATIQAKSDATMLCLEYDSINQLKDPIHYRLRMCLYRSCAETLAQRLKATNEIKNLFSAQSEDQ